MYVEGLLALQSQLQAVMRLAQHLEAIAQRPNTQAGVEYPVVSQPLGETGAQVISQGFEPAVPPPSPAEVTQTPVRWYAVVVGRTPGVYDDGKAVTKNIEGVNSNVVLKAYSRDDAVELYNEALRKNEVVRVTITRENLVADDTTIL